MKIYWTSTRIFVFSTFYRRWNREKERNVDRMISHAHSDRPALFNFGGCGLALMSSSSSSTLRANRVWLKHGASEQALGAFRENLPARSRNGRARRAMTDHLGIEHQAERIWVFECRHARSRTLIPRCLLIVRMGRKWRKRLTILTHTHREI